MRSSSKFSKFTHDPDIEATADAESAIEEMAEDARRVFEVYCSMGEPMNTKKLKSLKLMRMLKDMKLLRNGFVQTEGTARNGRQSRQEISGPKSARAKDTHKNGAVPVSRTNVDLLFV